MDDLKTAVRMAAYGVKSIDLVGGGVVGPSIVLKYDTYENAQRAM